MANEAITTITVELGTSDYGTKEPRLVLDTPDAPLAYRKLQADAHRALAAVLDAMSDSDRFSVVMGSCGPVYATRHSRKPSCTRAVVRIEIEHDSQAERAVALLRGVARMFAAGYKHRMQVGC